MLPVNLTANVSNHSDLFVCALGVGTVFVGLICLIILCKILGALCSINNKLPENKKTAPAVVASAPATKAVPAEIPNRRETIAAISAAIAEDLGIDVSAIRILSIEKM